MDNMVIYSGSLDIEQTKNYKAEGDELIKNLKDSTIYCYQFFFDSEIRAANGKRKKRVCQIAPLRSKMIFDLKKDYGVDVKPEDFSTILYQTLWDNGTWTTLNSYEGRCSFFAWLKKVAKNALVEWLEKEGYINKVRSRTVGSTRLALLSKSPTECKMIIDNMMPYNKYHDLLTAIYVERLPKEKIMKLQGLGDSQYESAKKKGENFLKDALLRSIDFFEEDFLRDKTKHIVTVSSEFIIDRLERCKYPNSNPLSDVFGTNLTDEEVSQKTIEFLYDFSAKLNWSEQDRYIWQRRFIVNADPVGLANEVGHTRAWLDTRYSRLNKRFNKAIKEWWNTHAA